MIDIVAANNSWRNGDHQDSSVQLKGRPFLCAFSKPWEATNAGFLSKTAWNKKGRKLKQDQVPCIVVRESAKCRGAFEWQYILEDLGNDLFVIATDWYEVYSLAQTAPKAARKHKSHTSERSKRSSFYVPVKFDASILPVMHRDYAYYFLSLLHWKWINWQADENGFVYLKHDYLTKVIPRHIWYEIRNTLSMHGIVEWDESYIKGEKSYGYRLSEEYWNTRRTVCKDDTINRRIQRLTKDSAKSLLPVHNWLRAKLDDVEFDLELAQSIIMTMHPDDDSPLSTKEYRLLLQESCQRIADGEYYLKCDKYGRVHTPITSLAKELRSCLLVGGINLVGIDLANSQPLIAGLCAKQYFACRQKKQALLKKSFADKANPYCYQELQYLASKAEQIIRNKQANNKAYNIKKEESQPHPRITTVKQLQVIGNTGTYDDTMLIHSSVTHNDEDDLTGYIRLCETGLLYESLTDAGQKRHVVKHSLYRDVFFGKNCQTSNLKARFNEQFPSVGRMLRELKQKNYKQSSWLMQNYEATIFIYRICRRITEERPDLVILTIHDSLLTVPSEVEYVQRIMEDEFRKLGISPTFRREDYGEGINLKLSA